MYKPIELKYTFNALEPFIDEQTMKVHYTNHYLGYLKNLNDLLKDDDENIPIEELIKDIWLESDDVRNNAGGYYNHSLFFNMLKSSNGRNHKLPNIVLNTIKRDYGTFQNFQNLIEKKAKERFGSGWVWWILLPSGETRIIQTPYQDNPMMYFDCKILLGVDVWEHAYYLKYKSNRQEYVTNIFNVIDWDYPRQILEQNS